MTFYSQTFKRKLYQIQRKTEFSHVQYMNFQEQREMQNSSQDSTVTPCIEYIIHHQMLDILSSICQADTPPGIRPYIFNLFIFLLARIQHTLILPYVNVYLPVRRLLMLSSTTKASPTENQELTFVTSLVTKLKVKVLSDSNT